MPKVRAFDGRRPAVIELVPPIAALSVDASAEQVGVATRQHPEVVGEVNAEYVIEVGR